MNGISKMLSNLLTILALAYGGVAALLFLMQDKLAYYPQIGREIQTTPREHGLDYKALTLATAVIVTFMLQMATVYVPAFNAIFKTEPLSVSELLVCIVLSSIVFVAVEIEKILIRRGWLYRIQSS